MNIYFWDNELSIHFSALLRGLQARGFQVEVYAHRELTERRRTLGWTRPDLGSCRVTTGLNTEDVHDIMGGASSGSVHITTGFRKPFNRAVVSAACRVGTRLGLYIEEPHPDGWRVVPKWAAYTLDLRRLRRYLDFVCALGNMGVCWYRRCGFPAQRLFPIGYAVEDRRESSQLENRLNSSTAGLRILFLGRCISIKRGDMLLRALRRIDDFAWQCDFVGGGPLQSSWQALSHRLGLGQRVRFLPAVPYDQVMGLLAQYDLLVLPSQHDGWGAVVNEALMAGLPVICSSACGAADLLGEPWRGTVFSSRSEQSLTQALVVWIQRGPLRANERRRLVRWADCLTGDSIAGYLAAVLEHIYGTRVCPKPPWVGL